MIALLLFLILIVLVTGGFLHVASEAIALAAALIIIALFVIIRKMGRKIGGK